MSSAYAYTGSESSTSLPPDENAGPTLLVISGILLALILVTTCLRFWTRYSLGRLGWDDYTIAMTAGLAVVRVGVQVGQVVHGDGRHRVYLSQADYQYVNMLGWVAQLLLFASVPLLKISILLFILRIRDSKPLHLFLRAVMAGLVITNSACIIILLAECSPVEAYWRGGGKCWDTRVRIYTIYLTIAYSLLTDLLCSFLPLFVIWKVQMPLRTKLLVWALMSMGLVATAFGALRAASLGLVTTDLSWSYCIAAIWSNLELFLGIIAANLAISRSVWMYLRHGRNANNSSSHHTHGSSRFSASRSAIQSRRPTFGTLSSQTYIGSRRGSDKDGTLPGDIPLESSSNNTSRTKAGFWMLDDGEDEDLAIKRDGPKEEV